MSDPEWAARIDAAIGEGPAQRDVRDDLDAGRRALRRRRLAVGLSAGTVAVVAALTLPMALSTATGGGADRRDPAAQPFVPTSTPSAIAAGPVAGIDDGADPGRERVFRVDEVYRFRFDPETGTFRLPEDLTLAGETEAGDLRVFELDLGGGESLYLGLRRDGSGVTSREPSGHLDAVAEILAAAGPDRAPETDR